MNHSLPITQAVTWSPSFQSHFFCKNSQMPLICHFLVWSGTHSGCGGKKNIILLPTNYRKKHLSCLNKPQMLLFFWLKTASLLWFLPACPRPTGRGILTRPPECFSLSCRDFWMSSMVHAWCQTGSSRLTMQLMILCFSSSVNRPLSWDT